MSSGGDIWPLTEEQKLIQETARRFAEREIKPVAQELDETAKFSEQIYRKMAEAGLLGITIPLDWGGCRFFG